MIKYGSHVAFLWDGSIRFGFIAAIVQRTNHEGEKTEYVVTSVDADGNANSDVTIKSEDDVADLDLTDAWRKGDKLIALAGRAKTYEWSRSKSDEILNPADPAIAEETTQIKI